MNSLKTKSISCGVVAVSVLTCEKFTNDRDITFSCFLCASPSACDRNALSPICINVLITWPTVHLMFTVCFLYPRISFWPLSAINTLSHYTEINSGSRKKQKKNKKKTHTLKNSQCYFCFLFSLVVGTDFFFSDKSCQNHQVPVCKGENPNIKYETFEPMCIRTLFLCRPHWIFLIMALLHLYHCLKPADFFLSLCFLFSQRFKIV